MSTIKVTENECQESLHLKKVIFKKSIVESGAEFRNY